jgi:chondroitin 4-sulfotransferase 11
MISHDYQCIFTHIPGTAGKSIRQLFGVPEFERNHEIEGQNLEYALGHRALSDFVNKKFYGGYFKFTFVRNPFDRLVSAFFYLDRGGCNEVDEQFRKERLAQYKGNFAAFVEDLPAFATAVHFCPQTVWLCDDYGKLLPDFIGRYENLGPDISEIGKRLGLTLPKLRVLNASEHNPYVSYYDDATKRRVAQAYGRRYRAFFLSIC